MNNKVKYGLSNVHIFPVKSETLEEITYDEAFRLSGAVSLSLDPLGDNNTFYADDIAYFSEYSNNGYEGELEVALLNEDFETKVLGYEKDKNGAIIENVESKSKRFAMAFEFKGDKNKTRHIIYNASASRPKMESETQEEKTKINTDKLKFNAIPDPSGCIKAKLSEGQEGYDNFYKSPYKKVPSDSEGDIKYE